MKSDVNPMHPGWRAALTVADAAPRCRAHSKRTGEPCRAPAVTGWRVCRMHDAGGGHPAGSAHPGWRHGMRSQEAVEMRGHISQIARAVREPIG